MVLNPNHMFIANVIFPAPSAVYVSTFFVPLATVLALATEFLICEGIPAGDARKLIDAAAS